MKEEKDNKNYTHLLAISTQVAGTIIGSSALGMFLDNWQNVEENYYTLVLTLLGIFLALYLLYASLKKFNS